MEHIPWPRFTFLLKRHHPYHLPSWVNKLSSSEHTPAIAYCILSLLHHTGHPYPKHLRLNRWRLLSLPPSQVKELPVCCEEVTEPSRLQTCLSRVRAGVRSKFFVSSINTPCRSQARGAEPTTTVPIRQSGQLPSLQSNDSNRAKSQSDEVVGDSGIGSQGMPSLHSARPGLPLS